MSLDSKLGDFENIRKLPKLRCTLSECIEEESENPDLNKAASKIQTSFRNYRARKSICLGETNQKILNGQSTINSKLLEISENNDELEPRIIEVQEKSELNGRFKDTQEEKCDTSKELIEGNA